jgi:hypothetical protein
MWTPTAADLGTHSIAISVSDVRGGSAIQTFQLEVIPAPPNRPPRFDSAPLTHVDSGADYVHSPIVTEPT